VRSILIQKALPQGPNPKIFTFAGLSVATLLRADLGQMYRHASFAYTFVLAGLVMAIAQIRVSKAF